MERHQIIEMMRERKLAGMRAAFDEILAHGLKRQHSTRMPRNLRWIRGTPYAPLLGRPERVDLSKLRRRSIMVH